MYECIYATRGMVAPTTLVTYLDFVGAPAVFTPWSIIHFATGVLAHAMSHYARLHPVTGFVIFFVLHGLYEAKDIIKTHYALRQPGVDPMNVKDSLPNSVGDQLSGLAGYVAAAYVLGRHTSIELAIGWVAASFLVLASAGMAKPGSGSSTTVHVWEERG